MHTCITRNVNRNDSSDDRSHILKEGKKARKIKVDDRKNVSTLKTTVVLNMIMANRGIVYSLVGIVVFSKMSNCASIQ